MDAEYGDNKEETFCTCDAQLTYIECTHVHIASSALVRCGCCSSCEACGCSLGD